MSNATRLMDAAVARMQGNHKPLADMGRSAPTILDAWELMREARAAMTAREVRLIIGRRAKKLTKFNPQPTEE